MTDRNSVSSVNDALSEMLVSHVWAKLLFGIQILFGIWYKFITKFLVVIQNVYYPRRLLAEVPLYPLRNIIPNILWPLVHLQN